MDTIILEDNIEYAIVKKVNSYVLLTNINDINDFCIRKIVNNEGEEYLETLDSEKEFDTALKLLTQN